MGLLRDMGPKLPKLWNAKLLKSSQKKSLLRSLIDKVVIHRTAHDQVKVRVVWRGGATTSEVVRVTVGKFAWLSGAKEMEKTIGELYDNGNYKLIIVLSDVPYISSAGAGVFIWAIGKAQDQGGNIVLVNPTPNVKEVFDLLGLTQIFTFTGTIDSAIKVFNE